jgi:hypothetical protein
MAGRLAGLQASPLGSTCVDGRGRCDAVEGSWDRVGRRRHGESFRSVQAPRKRCDIRLARAMPILIPFLNFRCKSPILQQRNAITAHAPASASGDLRFYFFQSRDVKGERRQRHGKWLPVPPWKAIAVRSRNFASFRVPRRPPTSADGMAPARTDQGPRGGHERPTSRGPVPGNPPPTRERAGSDDEPWLALAGVPYHRQYLRGSNRTPSRRLIEREQAPIVSTSSTVPGNTRKALGTKTVGDVLNECWRSDDSHFGRLASTTGTSPDALLHFFRQPLDRILAHVGYMSLRRSDAFDGFGRRPKGSAPAENAMVEAHNSPRSPRRLLPLCNVLGPAADSASGAAAAAAAAATNFALRHLKDFRNLEGLPSVVVYWPIWTRHGHFDVTRRDGRAASDLAEIVVELLAYRLQSTYRRTRNPRRHTLNVPVCLVMDGIESADQKEFFAKNPDVVTRFARELEDAQLAQSLVVVVVVVLSGSLPMKAVQIRAAAANGALSLFRVDE